MECNGGLISLMVSSNFFAIGTMQSQLVEDQDRMLISTWSQRFCQLLSEWFLIELPKTKLHGVTFATLWNYLHPSSTLVYTFATPLKLSATICSNLQPSATICNPLQLPDSDSPWNRPGYSYTVNKTVYYLSGPIRWKFMKSDIIRAKNPHCHNEQKIDFNLSGATHTIQ